MNRILEQGTPNETIAAGSNVHIRRIVVPIDLSAYSEKTASYAVGLAKTFGASITFLHVFSPEALTEFATGEVYEIYGRERSPAKERLAIFASHISQTYPRCQTEIRVGDTAEQTKLAALELDADLIITASYNPGFLDSNRLRELSTAHLVPWWFITNPINEGSRHCRGILASASKQSREPVHLETEKQFKCLLPDCM